MASRSSCCAILLLRAALSAHAVSVPRTPPKTNSAQQSMESLFPDLVAKVESHDQQLEQLRTENAELRKSFSEMQYNCSRAEEDIQTVKAETASLVLVDRRRKLQETHRCDESLEVMLKFCCVGGGAGGHRRFLQGQGCDAFPSTCTPSCASVFLEYYEGCQGSIVDMEAGEKAGFDSLYGTCKEEEQAKAIMLAGAVPAMIFKMEIIETDSERQQVQTLFLGKITRRLTRPQAANKR
jgi:TolA-binding protein